MSTANTANHTTIAAIEAPCRQDRLIADGYRVLPYRDLPRPYQLAIAWRMSMEAGDAWEVPFQFPDLPGECAPDLGKALFTANIGAYVAAYGDEMFGIVTVPADAAKANVMEHGSLSRFKTWDEYHAWYLRGGDMPEHGPDDRWPVLLDFGDEWETFGDGWHRFHAYCRDGHADIPLWFFPDERHLEHEQALQAAERAATDDAGNDAGMRL